MNFETINGLILINKPKNYTSHDVVNKVRKILNTKKVGHTGTLDPNATGVLPILIGNATKASKYLIEHNKTYVATLKLGIKTDTGDLEGQVIQTDLNFRNVNIEKIKNELKTFLGKQMQIPPMYSSIKINGKKLYEYAREGKEIQILCEDIATKLGTIGFMKELQRTKVNEYKIEDSVNLEDLGLENVNKYLVTIEEIFKDKNKILLDEKKLQLFLNGVQLTNNAKDGIYRIYNNNNFIGIGIIKNNLLKRDIIN